MRKRKLTLNDWGRIPTVKVTSEGRPSLRKFQAEEARREQEERATRERIETEQRMKPIRALEKEVKVAAREASERIRKFFSLPLQTMADFNATEAPADYVGDYPSRTGQRDIKHEFVVYKKFRDDLISRGCELSQDGWNRLGSYVSALAENRNIETSSAAWQQALDRLYDLGCFATGEVTNYQTPQTQPRQAVVDIQPKSKPNIDELLRTTSAESREGRKVLVEAVRRDVVAGGESAISAFWGEVQTMFNDAFTQEENNALARIMEARNLNCNSVRDWHKARVLGVRAGYLRETFLVPDERLAWDVETGRIPLDTFEQRQEFNRKVSELHGKIPLLG